MEYAIYQINTERDHDRKMFRHLGRDEYEVDSTIYDKVYEGFDMNGSNYDTLEGLFEKFNTNRPEDFRGHSMSVSDVVVINNKYPYYCDTVGWKEVLFNITKAGVRQ